MESGLSREEEMESSNGLINPEIRHAHLHHPYRPYVPCDVGVMAVRRTLADAFHVPMRGTSARTARYTGSRLRRGSANDITIVSTELYAQLDSMDGHVHHQTSSCASTEEGLSTATDFGLFG
jgi:hypothetical protein